uniref:Trypsin-like serine protease 8 n=1 Tax=Ostrinia nubilalis TaxID=29057 RepID=I6TRT9_OSTNU|nr:trypsin-like serine protease 8 [Ostrinia nubilalis]
MRVSSVLSLLIVGLAAVSAAPSTRIIGGSAATIAAYPEMASLLYSATNSGHRQLCGGTILNRRVILTAAYCTLGSGMNRWRTRVGSALANSGGTVVNTQQIIAHPQYNQFTRDNDISLIRTLANLPSNNNVIPGSISGPNYVLPDNSPVIAVGWGRINQIGQVTEQLQQVQMWTVNLNVCRQRYAMANLAVTDNMLCAGWLDVGGRDQCNGDEGGPVFHGRVVVGITSWRIGCGSPQFPGVNTRVSNYATWISSNAN